MTVRTRKSFSSNMALAGAVAASIWATSASALDLKLPELNGNYYGGAGYGASQIQPRVNESGFTVSDSTSSGVQLFLGRDISSRISVEGYYSNMGSATLDNGVVSGGIDYSTYGASGLVYLIGGGGANALHSRRGFNIYGRLGFGKLDNEGDGIAFNRINNWHYSAGLGAEYAMANGYGIRAEFNNFDSDARVVSFSIVKRFSYKGSRAIPMLAEPSMDGDAMTGIKIAAKDDTDGDGIVNSDDRCEGSAEGVMVDEEGCTFTGVLKGVNFSSGSARLTAPSTQALNQVISALKRNEQVSISVEAHTDSSGSAASNMDLSRKRAGSVVRYLLDTGGIDLDRMSAIGYGESRPRHTNRTAAGRLANRRVEIKTAQ